MQPQPITAREAVALLHHKVRVVQAEGLSRRQAEVMVARRFGLDPVKIAALLGGERAA